MPEETFDETIERGFGAFAERVPTDFIDNLKFRKQLRQACVTDDSKRQRIFAACKADPLFFFQAFCWLYEPRPKKGDDGKDLPQVFPFIAWDHQVPIMRLIHENLGFNDIGIEKSRGEGMSWIIVLFATWEWIFNDMASIGLVSKDENSVDNPDDPDSLMWKIDFLISKMPRWMVGDKDVDWKRDRGKHVIKNLRNGATISGYAATANVGTGGRKKWFGMDELSKFPRPQDKAAMASTQHVTNCRMVVATPNGADGEYYKMMHEPSGSLARGKMHWTDNPSKNRGLYRLVNGRAVAIDPENPLPPSYQAMSQDVLELLDRLRKRGYQVDKTIRSPWYDRECDRPAATPQNIAQELDIDYGGSAFRIFGDDCLSKAESTICNEVLVGDLDYNEETLDPVFDTVDKGPFRLWMPLDSRRMPPMHQYVVGCDLCSGLGGSYTSNSSMIAIDMVTNEQVLEFASNTTPPSDMADLAIATCMWLNDAYLAWETNGPGQGFTKRVIERGYPNVYYRTSQTKRKRTKTKELGWLTSMASKEAMFEALRSAIRTGALVIRSRELYGELGQYIRKGEKIFNSLSINAPDDSQGASHGDRVIGLGVALMAAKDRPDLATQETKRHREPPPGSMAEREAEYRASQNRGTDGWDARSLADFAKGG
jgi:hypothetical protein